MDATLDYCFPGMQDCQLKGDGYYGWPRRAVFLDLLAVASVHVDVVMAG